MDPAVDTGDTRRSYPAVDTGDTRQTFWEAPPAPPRGSSSVPSFAGASAKRSQANQQTGYSEFYQLLAKLEEEYERETGELRDEVQRLSDALDGGPWGQGGARDTTMTASAADRLSRSAGKEEHARSVPSCRTGRGCSRPAGDNFRIWPEWTGDEMATKRFRATEVMTKLSSKAARVDRDPEVKPHMGCTAGTCRPIHPSSTMKMTWELLGVFVLSVDVVYIPLQVFLDDSTVWSRITDWATLLYWAIDIVVTFLSGYYNRDGVLVMDFRSIAKRYFKGWFELDFAIVAVDTISNVLEVANLQSAGTGDSLGLARLGKFLRIARVMRTLRLLRLVKLRQLLYAVHERIQSESVAILIGLAQNMVGLLMINHYVACCWFLIGKVTGPASWLREYGIIDMDPAEQYLISLHWSMTQFTPASMKVFPVNGRERLFTVALLFVAILVFSSFISTITTAMTRLRSLTASVTSQKFLLRKFLKENRISKELSARITRYIDLAVEVHQRRTTQDKVSLLKLLSGPLTISLQREVHAPFLTVHPIFAHYAMTSKSAISQICFTAVAKNFYSKHDLVFDASVQAEYMYFLITGNLYYKRLKLPSTVRRTVPITQGMWFTEPVLWMHWVHLGSVKATIESEIITVRSSAFRAVSMSYPTVGQYARSAALEYVEWFRNNVSNGLVWDICAKWLDPDNYLADGQERTNAQSEVAAAEGWEAQMLAAASESDDDEVELPATLISNMKTQASCRSAWHRQAVSTTSQAAQEVEPPVPTREEFDGAEAQQIEDINAQSAQMEQIDGSVVSQRRRSAEGADGDAANDVGNADGGFAESADVTLARLTLHHCCV